MIEQTLSKYVLRDIARLRKLRRQVLHFKKGIFPHEKFKHFSRELTRNMNSIKFKINVIKHELKVMKRDTVFFL